MAGAARAAGAAVRWARMGAGQGPTTRTVQARRASTMPEPPVGTTRSKPFGILLLPPILGIFYYGWTQRHDFVHDGAEERLSASTVSYFPPINFLPELDSPDSWVGTLTVICLWRQCVGKDCVCAIGGTRHAVWRGYAHHCPPADRADPMWFAFRAGSSRAFGTDGS